MPADSVAAQGEAADAVGTALEDDPADLYRFCDETARGLYAGAVGELAAWSGRPPSEVAAVAVELCRGEGGRPVRHVGAVLLGDGRPELESALGCRLPGTVRLGRRLKRSAPGLYVAATVLPALGLAATVAVVCALTADSGVLLALSAAVLVLPLLLDFCRQAVDLLLDLRLPPPRALPGLKPHGGTRDAFSLAVVYPVMLRDVGDVARLRETVAANYRGNHAPMMQHVILADFPDGPSPEMPGDEEKWEALCEAADSLNADARASGGCPVHTGAGDADSCGHPFEEGPFLVLRRRRLWNERERRWMGWERKRGKLEEFNKAVLGEAGSSFDLGGPVRERLSYVRYVLTLDEDSGLPDGAAARLLGVLAHPLHRPVLDGDGAWVSGYGIVRPRTAGRPGGTVSRFQRTAFGTPSARISARPRRSVPQDCFGRAVFVGKGVYDVAAFHGTLSGRIPENAVLSHDKLEGMHVPTGLVSDVALLSGVSGGYLSYRATLHRWTRGDFHLLPWLFALPGSRRRRFGTLDRWQLASDMNQAFVPCAAAAVYLCSWPGFLPGGAGWWTLIATLGLQGRLLLGPLGALLKGGPPGRVRGCARAVGTGVRAFAMWLALLPDTAVARADAVVRAVWRQFVSRRRVLEWTASAQRAKETAASGSWTYWRTMPAGPLVAVALVAALAATGSRTPWFVWPVAAAWLLSPQIAHWLDRPHR